MRGPCRVYTSFLPSKSFPSLVNGGELSIYEVDALEMARQLTLFESQLFQKIKSTECLERAMKQRTENNDNITNVVQTSNRPGVSLPFVRFFSFLCKEAHSDVFTI
jgi:hypothetical protein